MLTTTYHCSLRERDKQRGIVHSIKTRDLKNNTFNAGFSEAQTVPHPKDDPMVTIVRNMN